MELQELYSLMERFGNSGLTRLEWRRADEKVVLCRELVQATPVVSPTPAPSTTQSAAEGDVVTAPLVGVFYAAPGPGEEPFVTPGKQVQKGQTLCILEAMKMMSEVPAPADCVIEEILGRDGEPVGYGDPLFRIRRI